MEGSLEDLLENVAALLRGKATLLNDCLELRNLTSESCPVLHKLDKTLVDISETFGMIRKEIAEGKERLKHAQESLNKTLALKDRISYATRNFPGLEAHKCAMKINRPAVSVVPHDMMFKRTVEILGKSLQFGNQALLIASSNFLSKFLRKENLPSPIPFHLVLNLSQTCMAAVCKFLITSDCEIDASFVRQLRQKCRLQPNMPSNGDFPPEFQLLESSPQVIHSCARLATNHSVDPCARESTFSYPPAQIVEGLDQNLESETSLMMNDLMITIHDSLHFVFLPYSYFLGTADELGKRICAHILSILSELYDLSEWSKRDPLQKLTANLIHAHFIKFFWNNRMLTYSSSVCNDKDVKRICCNVLKCLLWSLLEEDQTNELLVSAIKNGVEHFDDSFEHCAAVLQQKHSSLSQALYDSKLFAAQFTFMLVCYNSYLRKDHG